jgi:ATP-dependent 26S proteasome regulatory subunit
MPDAAQRKSIWTRSFSSQTVFEDSISWDAISRDYELTGGAIMNVVQYASIMAMSRGERMIRQADILQGIRREYQKEGRMPR